MNRVMPASVAALVATLAIGSGCATKKHVQATITPLTQRIEQLENKSRDAEKSIAGLETGVARVDERVKGADARAGQAAQEAARANERATQVGSQAEAAAKAANAAQNGVDQVARETTAKTTELSTRIGGLEDYSKIAEGAVSFAVNKAALDADAKQSLDSLAAKVQSLKRYVVEVEGYTDQTGPVDYNIQLSQKRAQSVVHYLTVQHKLPLYRVHLIGVGEENPVADNKTRDGRKQNRRVEVRVLSADEALTGRKAD